MRSVLNQCMRVPPRGRHTYVHVYQPHHLRRVFSTFFFYFRVLQKSFIKINQNKRTEFCIRVTEFKPNGQIACSNVAVDTTWWLIALLGFIITVILQPVLL